MTGINVYINCLCKLAFINKILNKALTSNSVCPHFSLNLPVFFSFASFLMTLAFQCWVNLQDKRSDCGIRIFFALLCIGTPSFWLLNFLKTFWLFGSLISAKICVISLKIWSLFFYHPHCQYTCMLTFKEICLQTTNRVLLSYHDNQHWKFYRAF